MNQVVFLFFLQSAGILFGLTFRKWLPLAFLTISGLLWGSLFWALGSLILLVLRLPYTLTSMGFVCIGMLAAFVIWNLAHNNLRLERVEWNRLAIWLVISSGIFGLLSRFNLTFLSPDSLHMILNGRAFVNQGFSPFLRTQLALRGVFVPLLQSASPLLGLEYLYALQPAIILFSGVLFIYFGWRITGHLNPGRPSSWLVAALFIGMASTYYLPFQTFYIHTNLLSGMYLMVALGCFWLAFQERNAAWMVFGMLALTAFSLLRTEAPLFGLLFLALLFSNPEIPYRARLAAYLPYAALFMAWYLYLLAGSGSGTYILNPSNILLMLAALLGFSIMIAASRWAWIQNRLLPNLPWIMMVGLFALCTVLFALDAGRMGGFLNAMLLNISVYGLWGTGWFLVAAGVFLAAALPAIPHERLFSVGIPAFLILLYAVSTRNVGYQLDWGDSANRMLTHIFPSAFLYLTVKFGRGIRPVRDEIYRLQKQRPFVLAALGCGLIVFGLVLALTGK